MTCRTWQQIYRYLTGTAGESTGAPASDQTIGTCSQQPCLSTSVTVPSPIEFVAQSGEQAAAEHKSNSIYSAELPTRALVASGVAVAANPKGNGAGDRRLH